MERISTGGGRTEELYDPSGHLLGHLNGANGVWWEEYVHFDGRLLWYYTQATNTSRYFHVNALGSLGLATDQTGAAVEEMLYYPFGTRWQNSTGFGWDEKFAQFPQRDEDIQKYEASFREYAPGLGRWMSPDRLAGNVMNPQSLDRYTYALNNPVSNIDPLGLDPCPKGVSADVCVVAHVDDEPVWTSPIPGLSNGPGSGSNGPGGGGGGSVNLALFNLSPRAKVCEAKVQGLLDSALHTPTKFIGPQLGGHQDDPKDPGLINGAYNFIFFAPGLKLGDNGNKAVPGAHCGRFGASGLHIVVPGTGCNPANDPFTPYGYDPESGGSYFTAHRDSASPGYDVRSFVVHILLNYILKVNHGC